MTAHPVLLQKKYARIVRDFAEKENISIEKALAFFYRSEVYQLMSKGISDMHCRTRVKKKRENFLVLFFPM